MYKQVEKVFPNSSRGWIQDSRFFKLNLSMHFAHRRQKYVAQAGRNYVHTRSLLELRARRLGTAVAQITVVSSEDVSAMNCWNIAKDAQLKCR
jgi:hypothetical protein